VHNELNLDFKIPTFLEFNQVIPIIVLTCSIQAGGSIILSNLDDNTSQNRDDVSLKA